MQKKTLSAKLLASPHIVWSALFIVAPLIMVAYYSFTNADGNFTLENIKALSDYKEVFLNSIWYGIAGHMVEPILWKKHWNSENRSAKNVRIPLSISVLWEIWRISISQPVDITKEKS